MKFDLNVMEWFSAQFIRDKFNAEVKNNNLSPKGVGIHYEANSYHIDEYGCTFLVKVDTDEVFVDKNNPFIKKFLRTKKLERIL